MQGPETPPVMLKVSDRISRSRIWSAVHRQEVPEADLDAGDAEEASPFVIRLGLRGTPVPAPRRAR